MVITNFMDKLLDDMAEWGYSNKTIKIYFRNLSNLSEHIQENPNFENLNFLKKKDKVIEYLETKTESTKKNYLGMLASITKNSDKKPINKLNEFYGQSYTTVLKSYNENQNKKTKKQETEWLNWSEIENIRKELYDKSDELFEKKNGKNYTNKDYTLLLHNLLASLYIDIPPRRNDYLYMYVVPSIGDKDADLNEYNDKDKNYLILEDKKPIYLIFNRYKTSKTYGQQLIEVDNDYLNDSIVFFLSAHPSFKNVKQRKKNFNFKLLVNSDGQGFDNNNSITRELYKIFNKKIGATMLRHIYLTDKYDIKEMKDDANAMAHSVNQQKNYIIEDTE